MLAKEFYEQERINGNTYYITSNPDPDYELQFYRNIFRLMDGYANQQAQEKQDYYWFNIFNERYPDEVKEILDKRDDEYRSGLTKNKMKTVSDRPYDPNDLSWDVGW